MHHNAQCCTGRYNRCIVGVATRECKGMGRPAEQDSFAAKLTLALGRANLSRALLAREVGVDKSVVARWAGGQVSPTEHNLLALTHVIARRVPELTLDDWRLPEAAFAVRLARRAAAIAAAHPELAGAIELMSFGRAGSAPDLIENFAWA